MRVLVTGATGYIGGRLVPLLLEAGHEVCCLSRDPSRLDAQPWRERVDALRGDVLDPASLGTALEGCGAAYYLVHAMAEGAGFDERDRLGARHFRDAADAAGLQRIVYLGGLAPEESSLSKHLDSRQEVGRILAEGPVPVTEFRAAVIIGSGSMSFEMLRYLTEVLPVMTTPRWVRQRCQPIAVGDVLDLLRRSLDDPEPMSRILEIGGPDVLTYQEMMRVYAEEAGLRRLIIPVPLLTPGLSSLWVGLVTPLPPRVARPLIEGLRAEVLVRDDTARRLLPHDPLPFRDALRLALDAPPEAVAGQPTEGAASPAHPAPGDPKWSGGRVFIDRRVVPTDAAPHHLFWAFSRIGGDVGYYGLNWAWKLRGLLDRLVGGVGLRRGRRHPEHLREGETLDFWRVDRITPGRALRLQAEMRLPGRAWLQWEVAPMEDGADLVQTAIFRPRGLLGRLYWFVMAPFHYYIFPRMAWKMAAAAEERGYSCP
ncbi:MAG: SDR family oxidoreductase [Actinobacteria bacterium]|nr:SDR family oxidoreductase [Actinomycetota bacterium]